MPLKVLSLPVCNTLLEVMDRLLDAADNYQKSRALNVAKECYEMVCC